MTEDSKTLTKAKHLTEQAKLDYLTIAGTPFHKPRPGLDELTLRRVLVKAHDAERAWEEVEGSEMGDEEEAMVAHVVWMEAGIYTAMAYNFKTSTAWRTAKAIWHELLQLDPEVDNHDGWQAMALKCARFEGFYDGRENPEQEGPSDG